MQGQATHIQMYSHIVTPGQSYTHSTLISQVDYPIPSHVQNSSIYDDNTDLFNFEVRMVALLLLVLPMVIYLAYRYGKKMGRKENIPLEYRYFGPEAIRRNISEESTSDNSFPHLEETNSKVSSTESSPRLGASSFQKHTKKVEQSLSPPSLNESKRDLSVQTEDKQIKEFTLDDKNKLSEDSNNKLVPLGYSSDLNNNPQDFKIVHVQTWDREMDKKGVDQELFEEQLKLHSEDAQVLKKEVKQGVVIRKNGNYFQKTEIRELCTTYDPQSDVPMINAKLLQETYKNAPIHKKLFGLTKEASDGKKSSGLLAIADADTKHYSEDKSAAQSLPIKETTVSMERQISLQVEAKTLVEKTKTMSEFRMENVVEKYGLPDETGKFNKIFKDVEWIGEGSFGEVYKVVHRLDGKLYAVKKVKLKLGRFEELKKESKVFREVFAMTDLHHHNIVRYSTCWVEIEWDKENPETKDKLNKSRGYNESVDLGDISESGLHEEEASEIESEPADYSRNSEMGFEWDVSAGEKEKSKKTGKKVMDKVKEIFKKKSGESKILPILQRKRSHLRLKSLSKSFIEEELDESSRNSSVSRVESVNEVPGCKLYLYIQMEYCEGQSLKYYLENSNRKIVREKALEMFKKLLEGVHTIHMRGILHRDLKPANIFLDSHENVKIGDFGLALLDNFDEQADGLTPKEITRRDRKLHSLKVGTPMYTSPEQESGGHYDQKTDIYSLGLIFYEMLIAFDTHHERYQHFAMIRNKRDLPMTFKRNFEEESEFVLRMTQTLPEDRPTSDQLLVEVDRLLEKLRLNNVKNNSLEGK